MQNSISDNHYTTFAQQFSGKQTSELVDIFNGQTRHHGWVGMRAYHDRALIDEFRRRGIDVSAVSDGQSISFAHAVRYDEDARRLVIDSDNRREKGA